MKLYLIRHTSVDVPQGTCYGQSNVPLKLSFEEEAEIVKQNLKGIDFDAIYSSPLSRCRKLARYCGFQEHVQWIDRLKEMHFGEWEMMNWDHIEDENIKSWYQNWIYQPATGGESFEMLYDRVASLLDEIKKEDYKNVAIFTHGGVISCVKVYVGDSTLERAFDSIPAYGEIVCLTI